MKKIVSVTVLGHYQLDLIFDDGVRGTIDLSELAGKGVFSIWHNPGVFEGVKIGSSGELSWNDQADLCLDSLYLKATSKKPEDVFPVLHFKATNIEDFIDNNIAFDRLHDATDVIITEVELRKSLGV